MSAKVEIVDAQSPSQQAVAKADAEFIVTDVRGRKIKLKKPSVLAQFRLVEVLGQASSNDRYMSMVLPLIFVAAIDADPVLMPNSKREVEALIQRLDEDGIAAVGAGIEKHFGKPDPEADKAALKK